MRTKRKGRPARAALDILCESNQATENIGNIPRSFLRMRIAIDIMKKIAISVTSQIIVCEFNYSRMFLFVKFVID